MNSLIQDLKYGLRMLAKNPGFTAVAVITLALGIGANTAIFSVVNAVLLRPLPYRDADRLVAVWEENPDRGWYHNIVSAANFVDWREQNHVFTEMAAVNIFPTFTLTGTREPEEVVGQQVTTNLFSLLGVQPVWGRDFLPEEDKPGGPRVVILSYGLWQRRYGGDPTLVGKQVSLNNKSYTVIGIMPSDFYFPPFWRELIGEVGLWVPGHDLSNPSRTNHAYIAVARLKSGVSLHRAQAEMDTIAGRIQQEYPENKGWGVGLVQLREQAVGDTRLALLVLLTAVGFVLLIACANVANLMLARASTREREIAIRTALGAGRGRLIRQMLTESLVLASLGGGIGLVLAAWGIQILVANFPKGAFGLGGGVGLGSVTISGSVLAFTMVLAFITGIGFGLAPALAASKPDLNQSLKQSGRSSSEASHRNRLRDALIVSEFALALVLLVGAGLMIKTLAVLSRVDLGFNPENVLTARIPLLGPRYEDPQTRAQFFQQLLERVKSLPGVRWASVSRGLPIFGWSGMDFVTEDHPSPPPNERPDANYVVIGPDYFRVLSIPLLRGRFFTDQDAPGALDVAIVNEELARQRWPGQDPIGKRFRVGRNIKLPWLLVVGVVGNVRSQWPTPDYFAEIYVPYTQYPWLVYPRNLVVRTVSNPTTVAAAIRDGVTALDRDQPVSNIRTLDQLAAQAVGQQRFAMVLLGLFAALALVLATVGVYGVMSYSVERRTHEIGIRMALGADRKKVLRLVIAQGFILTLAGVVIGVSGALALTRFLESLLFGVEPTDPLTFVLVSILLTSVALLACYIPARRATKVDPMVALRHE
ncbi:MAG: ABC transporter permease [Acidobacteria bacterium]|nr:ABC transporter permease [Acidobacteriota bacterium]